MKIYDKERRVFALKAADGKRVASEPLGEEERIKLSEELLEDTGYTLIEAPRKKALGYRTLPYCLTDPLGIVPDDTENVLSAEQTAKVWSEIKAANSRNKAMCLLIAVHGMRPPEISLLKHDAITVEGTGKRTRYVLFSQNPHGRTRIIEIIPSVYDALMEWVAERVWLLTEAGQPVDEGALFMRGSKPTTSEHNSEKRVVELLERLGARALGAQEPRLTYTLLQRSTREALKKIPTHFDPEKFDAIEELAGANAPEGEVHG